MSEDDRFSTEEMNRYNYVSNNPVGYVDPQGNNRILVVCVALASAAAVDQFLVEDRFKKCNQKNADAITEGIKNPPAPNKEGQVLVDTFKCEQIRLRTTYFKDPDPDVVDIKDRLQ